MENVLSTRNLTNYPAICAEATASFAVLSDTINIVHATLVQKGSYPELVGLVKQLQNQERSKLNYTAALHLERIRRQQQNQQPSSRCGGNIHYDDDDEEANILNDAPNAISNNHSSESIETKLLQQSIRSLQGKILDCIDCINEIIEELRCVLTDET